MTVEAEANPYAVPESASAQWVTPKGYTVDQCQRRFLAAGVIGASVGGGAVFFVGSNSADILATLYLPGLAFGIALWISIERCIGSVSHVKKLMIVFGSLMAFATCGFVYTVIGQPSGWRLVQPVSWTTLKPCLLGPVAGATILIGVLAVTGRNLTKKMLLSGWGILSVGGFVAMFASDELGMRHHYLDEVVTAAICVGIYIAVAAGVIGWQMAAANLRPVDVPRDSQG
jgi:hypothetical protein